MAAFLYRRRAWLILVLCALAVICLSLPPLIVSLIPLISTGTQVALCGALLAEAVCFFIASLLNRSSWRLLCIGLGLACAGAYIGLHATHRISAVLAICGSLTPFCIALMIACARCLENGRHRLAIATAVVTAMGMIALGLLVRKLDWLALTCRVLSMLSLVLIALGLPRRARIVLMWLLGLLGPAILTAWLATHAGMLKHFTYIYRDCILIVGECILPWIVGVMALSETAEASADGAFRQIAGG